LIEIGRERTFEIGLKRLGNVSGNIASLLVLVWLIRVWVFLGNYSAAILAIAFALVFAHHILDTRTSAGKARGLSSLLWGITSSSIIVLILILVLGWIAGLQHDSLTTSITDQIPNLLILAIATGIGAYATNQLAPRTSGPVTKGPPIKVTPSSTLDFGKVKLSTKNDSMLLPIRASKGTVGAVVYGDINAAFDTPMGKVTGYIPGPVTTIGIPFRGEKADGDEVSKLTGKTLSQLQEETDVDTTLPRGEIFNQGFTPTRYGETRVDLPFIHVSKNSSGESVKVGPIHVTTGPKAEDDVEVGPFDFNPCDFIMNNDDERTWFAQDEKSQRRSSRRRRRFGRRWLAKANEGNAYLSASPEGLQARWNGSSLRLKGDSMKMAVGQDGFVYTPTELETYSPLHTLHVTPTKATLNANKFTLNIIGNRVILRSEDGSKSTESPGLAKDLLDLLTETANSQVKSVMSGQPMELDEMLLGTEEVLKKHE
jgi:hypothetical protein